MILSPFRRYPEISNRTIKNGTLEVEVACNDLGLKQNSGIMLEALSKINRILFLRRKKN